jgi:CubicO group peptidase (beta-lactamase class C family)
MPTHLPSENVCRTRRRFLATATGAVLLPGVPHIRAAEGKLAALDELMSTFMREHQPPGAALGVSYKGRLVYARGFGHADVQKGEPVRAQSLFRIASVSKPFTATGVMHLVEKGRLSLDDKVFSILKLEPLPGARMDPRLQDITVRHCLQHTGGWDRDKSLDPMGAEAAEKVAEAMHVPLPIRARQIVRFTLGQALDFDPGTQYVYSNFGYCVLGRVIEAVAKQPYEQFIQRVVLSPLGITHMQQGKNLLKDRAPDEVRYYDAAKRKGRAISGPNIGKEVPLPYGVECIETMDANGGWIASVVDLLRFAVGFDDPARCPILSEATLRTMLAPPPGPVGHRPDGKPKAAYYACGWDIHPGRHKTGLLARSHGGGLAGSNTFLACRDDGVDLAVLFNSDADPAGAAFTDVLMPLLHQQVDAIKDWPEADLFGRL